MKQLIIKEITLKIVCEFDTLAEDYVINTVESHESNGDYKLVDYDCSKEYIPIQRQHIS
jgi:hypothetical protein